MEIFRDWLIEELDRREWSAADLARNAGISKGSISNILSGNRQPGNDICEAIAHAFKIAPEIVYRRAGLLPPARDVDERTQELVHLFGMMSEDNQDETIDYARLKLKRQEERETKNAKRVRTP
jgi:transcriptional regulator with XRE-family HTH domain